MLIAHLSVFVVGITTVYGIFVDTGNPYSDGPLDVSEVTFSKTFDHSPKHSIVFYPQKPGEYATIYFVAGVYTLVLAEYYSVFLRQIAAHGYFVFAIDYDFPAKQSRSNKDVQYNQDINIYFQQLEFFKSHVKTVATPRYDVMGLLCHSAGCDITLKMIQDQRVTFNASAFLEPVSRLIGHLDITNIPALVYGTEMAEVGPEKCNIPGIDYKVLYPEWKCPKVEIEVAKFGHCDLLDATPWSACQYLCTTSDRNTTDIDGYRQAAQGIVSGFFTTMLQGRKDAISYITDETKVPIKLLVDESDLNC